ncbi:MAG: hypothetical protein B6I38_09720, partial [Anaerolineaceae bacterium 4572_5.1]
GRVSIPLARAGYLVWGLDWDESALGVARANLAVEPAPTRERVSFIRADMTNFSLDVRFGAAILPCNTFSGLIPKERKSVLEGVTAHLLPRGVFAISLPNPTLLARFKDQTETEPTEEAVFTHPQTGNPVQASSIQECTGDGVVWKWHYDHLLPDGKVERLTMSTKHYYTPAGVYTREFQEAGLRVLARYGDFENAPYTPESLYLILVAQKEMN